MPKPKPKPVIINNFEALITFHNDNYQIRISPKHAEKLSEAEQLALFVRVLAASHKDSADYTSNEKNKLYLYAEASDAISKQFDTNRRVIERLDGIKNNIEANKSGRELDKQRDALYKDFLLEGKSESLMNRIEELEKKTQPAVAVHNTKDMFQQLGVNPQKPLVQIQEVTQLEKRAPEPESQQRPVKEKKVKEEKESHFSFEHSTRSREKERYYVSRAYFGRQQDGSYVAKANSTHREIKKDYVYTADQVSDFINRTHKIEMSSPPPAMGGERITRGMGRKY